MRLEQDVGGAVTKRALEREHHQPVTVDTQTLFAICQPLSKP
jgi:hypothetical protein